MRNVLFTADGGFMVAPGDKIRVTSYVNGHATETEYTVASVRGNTLRVNPNWFQRAWFWLQRQFQRVAAWMWKWDARFKERYEDTMGSK